MALHYIRNSDDLTALSLLDGEPVVGVDLETTALIPQQGEIRLIQLATEQETLVVDLAAVDVRETLGPLMTDPTVTKVFHNAEFDVKWLLHHWKLVPRNLFCTYLASKLLAMGLSARHSLADVSWRYLHEAVEKELQRSDWSGPLTEDQIRYAALDAELVRRLYPIMNDELSRLKLHKVAKLEFRTVIPMAEMELRGIFVDPEMLTVVCRQLQKRADKLEEAILEELRGADDLPGMNTLNINAPDQVKKALAEKGIDVKDTNDATLRPWASRYPYVDQLLEHRHLSRILGSTLNPFKEHILPETGRIHANYHQFSSPSGRMACSDPNIQAVPREKQVRACFKPETGNLFIIADYSQIELRVAAGIAGDKLMLETYERGGDIHRLTAALTMGKDQAYVTHEERQAAKAINFGLVYAMGSRGLQFSAKQSYGVEMSLEQASRFRDRFFENYKGIREWHRQLEKQGRTRGYVRTGAGRIRSYKGIEIRVNEMFNVPIQGTAAEGIKSAMCIFSDRVREADLDASIVAVIHDELIVEVHQDQAEKVRELLINAMIEGMQWLVPGVVFTVDAHIALSWAEKS